MNGKRKNSEIIVALAVLVIVSITLAFIFWIDPETPRSENETVAATTLTETRSALAETVCVKRPSADTVIIDTDSECDTDMDADTSEPLAISVTSENGVSFVTVSDP